MPSTNSLLNALQKDFPDLSFQQDTTFQWDVSTKTIHFDSEDDRFNARLLHEVSHAALEHSTYDKDIDLVALERDAWRYARTELAPRYNMVIDADTIQDDMDTYREWLHARSTCPKCEASGLQIKKYTYRCVACGNTWKVNEARICALRRYTT